MAPPSAPASVAEVPLAKAYRLLNHGPTVLVGAAHGGRRNVMAAAWAMPLDFEPPKVAVVLDKQTYTRTLIEASGVFALAVPCRAQADLVQALGSHDGREIEARFGHDKLAAFGATARPGRMLDVPLVDGCVAWLECRLLPEPAIQQRHDLFLGQVVAAEADTRVFRDGRWHFGGHDELRTLHHVAGGHFILAGDTVDAQPLPPA